MKRTWTIIGVADVPRSTKWYQSLLGLPAEAPVHDYFGQIVDSDGTVLLCLHEWGAHDHPSLKGPENGQPGNGLLLFFRIDDILKALPRALTLVPRLETELHKNPNTGTVEFSLRDPDGYHVTLSAVPLGKPRASADHARPAAKPRASADQAKPAAKRGRETATVGARVDAKGDVIQLKISLKEVRPSVWRRIEIPATYTFWDLHVAIQDAMGWDDYHLHAFRIGDPRKGGQLIGVPDNEFEGGPVFLTGWEVSVTKHLGRVAARATYDYDFGDGWSHEVRVEAIGPRVAGMKYPRCVGGARRCPPEDCGGPHGYAALLATIANPRHPEHKSMLEWLGGPIDPAAFDPAAVRFDDPEKRWKIVFG